MKLLRTIRLDASDTFVFARAAEPGEWAVPGGFLFWDDDVATLTGPRRAAFRAGFLGVASFGWSTLTVVAEASSEEHDAAVAALADGLVRHLDAPDLDTALPAAREEIAFSASLAVHPVGTLVALHRSAEGSGIRERFRTLAPGQPTQGKAFAFVAVDGEEAIEAVDLKRLLGGKT